MDYSEDHIALAAEYALGTLDADERAQVESMMSVDRDYAAVVQAWEYRLGVLNQMVGLVEPRPIVWEGIKAAIGPVAPQSPFIPHDMPPLSSPLVSPADMSAEPVLSVEPDPLVIPPVPPAVDATNVVRLSTRARRWRGVATAVSAIAAALVALIGLQLYQPELLPDELRPKPRTQIVEVKTPATAPAPSAQYVAVLQGQGGGPAFILTVDGASKNFTVRRVGAIAPDPGRSYELWLISDKLPRPRSLGVIGNGEFTTRPVLAGYDRDVINNATYAVTVEQAGGSPDGAPHSQPVFTGKLIEAVPAAQPAPK